MLDEETQLAGTLDSIQVGRPQTYPDGPQGRPWTSAVVKHPVDGPITVNESGLAGDDQADKRHHGGIEKAVLAYSADHYPAWRGELRMRDLLFGAFAENLTLAGIGEDNVCIGDTWTIGSVHFQVSQPRQPCWKIARRWKQPNLVKRIIENGRSGWYLRVLRAGEIDLNQSCCLLERPYPEWTISRANTLMYSRTSTRAEMLELISLDLLSSTWKKDLM